MFDQALILPKCLTAEETGIAFRFMNLEVDSQVRTLSESTVAEPANERFDSQVNSLMFLQVTFSCGSISASSADVGSGRVSRWFAWPSLPWLFNHWGAIVLQELFSISFHVFGCGETKCRFFCKRKRGCI